MAFTVFYLINWKPYPRGVPHQPCGFNLVLQIGYNMRLLRGSFLGDTRRMFRVSVTDPTMRIQFTAADTRLFAFHCDNWRAKLKIEIYSVQILSVGCLKSMGLYQYLYIYIYIYVFFGQQRDRWSMAIIHHSSERHSNQKWRASTNSKTRHVFTDLSPYEVGRP